MTSELYITEAQDKIAEWEAELNENKDGMSPKVRDKLRNKIAAQKARINEKQMKTGT